jgi:citrate synthase
LEGQIAKPPLQIGLIYEKLPSHAELRRFSDLLAKHELMHEDMKFHFEGFPPNAHPMAILSSMINAAGCYYPDLLAPQEAQNFDHATAFILSQVRAIAAFAYRKSRGLPFIYPKPQYKYTPNFLHMMFSVPYADYDLKPEVVKLYPNVDFYSGIMMRAIGIPTEMFTVIFAIGRIPGWIANYREVSATEAGRICRPRQIYVGEPLARYVPIDQRPD